MRHTKLRSGQAAANGFTDLFIVLAADFSAGFSATDVVLDALAVGDVIGNLSLIEVKTAVTGPTGSPTVTLREGGSGTSVSQAVVVSAVTYSAPAAAQAAFAVVTAGNLTLRTAVGGGDGAAATAGEVWVWCNIFRKGERTTEA